MMMQRPAVSLLLWIALAATACWLHDGANAFSVVHSSSARPSQWSLVGRLSAKPLEDEGGVVEPPTSSDNGKEADEDDDVALLKDTVVVNGSAVPPKEEESSTDLADEVEESLASTVEEKAAKELVKELMKEDPPSPLPSAEEIASKNTLFLQSLGAITNRGEFATPQQKEAASSVISSLEALDDATEAKNVLGTWELVYSNTQLFRASPFFLAGRATCTTPEQAQQYDWFCNMHRQALAISQIRAVRQIVTPTQLVSEFEVEAGSVPFVSSYSGGLPVTITGAIVSTADLTYLEPTNTEWELFMDTVEIKGSNLPLLRQLLDIPSVQLATRNLSNAIESVVPDYSAPKPALRTTYCTEQYRVTRDQDDNVFVYVRTSDSTIPSDYTAVDADLGLLGLLEGFNDAVTKLFI